MTVNMISVKKESVIFSVNGKTFEVPRDIEINNPENTHDITQHFAVNLAKNLESNKPAEKDVREAIVKFIDDEFS